MLDSQDPKRKDHFAGKRAGKMNLKSCLRFASLLLEEGKVETLHWQCLQTGGCSDGTESWNKLIPGEASLDARKDFGPCFCLLRDGCL